MAHTPIFVVGTGRSGTTILYRSLGCHPDIHTFPREMRFTIDPGGLSDLVDGLTNRYHPAQAREAIYNYERLMRVYLAEPARAPYRGFDMPAWIGEPYYTNRLNQFIDECVDFEFKGEAWQISPQNDGRLIGFAKQITKTRQKVLGGRQAPFHLTLPRPALKCGKFFSDRQQLIKLTSEFINDLFCYAAQRHHKSTWCEKTPQHLLTLDFIWELFPESRIIHIKRDPRGVAYSLTKQFWAPSEYEKACRYLQPVYQRWQGLKTQLKLDGGRYLEIKLEDFSVDPTNCLAEIAEFCSLKDDFEDLPAIDPQKVTYWQEKLGAEERSVANQILTPFVAEMGYEA